MQAVYCLSNAVIRDTTGIVSWKQTSNFSLSVITLLSQKFESWVEMMCVFTVPQNTTSKASLDVAQRQTAHSLTDGILKNAQKIILKHFLMKIIITIYFASYLFCIVPLRVICFRFG